MCRVLDYPPNATKNKITIYQDDLNRLNEDEFLNDTIIEFYLTYYLLLKELSNDRYTLDNLPPEIREKTHIFNTFFWTNLNRRNGAGYIPIHFKLILENEDMIM
jgi:sentrin-specific protease 7